jgi:uncharacterized protein
MALNKRDKSKKDEEKKKSQAKGSAKSKAKSKYTKTSLKAMRKSQLVELALKMGLTGVSGLKKDDLIEKILRESSKEKEKTKVKKPKKVELSEQNGQTFTSSKKYEIENINAVVEPEYPVETKDLPSEYDDTKLILLIRDPWWAFVYWEISQEVREKYNIVRNQHNKSLKLRVYDVTDNREDDYFDVDINDHTNNWYIRLPKSNRHYVAELVVVDEEGEKPITKSNKYIAPRETVSDNYDVEWMVPDWAKIYEASAGYREKGMSEKEISQKLLKHNLSSVTLPHLPSSEMPSSHFLGASEYLAGSFPSSGSAVKVVGEKEKHKNFWLKADCELIVYGATEPDAVVKVKGEPIRLSSDGSFTLRFALPDGNQDIDIKAVNNDGDMEKEIVFYIKRETKTKA